MTKGRLNTLKHAGLFLALFAFGILGVGLTDAQATMLVGGSIAPLPGPPAPTVSTVTPGTAGLPGVGSGSAANTTLPLTFGGFVLVRPISSPIIPIGGSVAGSTTPAAPTSPTAPPTAPVVSVTAAPTLDPEPATILLFGSGLIAVAAVGRRRLRNR